MDETPNDGPELARALADPSPSIATDAAPAFDPRDLIPTPIFFCTIEGRIAWVNAAAEELLGRPSAALVGESFVTLFPAEERTRRARGLVRHHRRGTTDFNLEAPLATASEAAHWVGLQVRRVTTSAGRQAYVCSAHDLEATHQELETLRRRTKELAARAEQADAAAQLKSDFLGTLSSELRAPMNGVISMSRLLLDSTLDRDQQTFAEVIHESGRTLLELVDDILDFTRIESGQLKIERMDFDVRVMLDTISRLLAPEAERRGVRFAAHAHHRVPSRLIGDPGRLRQVLMQLVNLAMHRSAPEGVQVRIDLSEETPSEARLRFGVSYAPLVSADLDQVFESFVVDDPAVACHHGGAGLGLNIARRLVLLMGGECGLFSETDGTRTCWFRVPLEKQAERVQSGESTVVELSSLRALVCDVTGPARDELVTAIASFTASCDVVESGESAIELIRAAAEGGRPYGAVFAELENTALEPSTLARTVRCEARLSACRLLLLAKLGRPGDAARAEEWGFGAYLVRPCSPEQLEEACRAVLRAPAAPADAAADAPVASGRIVTRHTLAEQKKSRVRVLVVEDNPLDQLVVQSALRRMGYEPEVATNGQEALTAIEARPCDVILMDLQMPELDGIATTREIRSREGAGRRTPILALTASSSDEDRARCLEAGMDDFLAKPLDLELLSARVEEWIQKPQPAQAQSEELPQEETTAIEPVAETAAETTVETTVEFPAEPTVEVAEAPTAEIAEAPTVGIAAEPTADNSATATATAMAKAPATAVAVATAPAPAPEFEPMGAVLDAERLETSSMGSPEIRGMLVQAFFTHLEKPLGALRLAMQAGDAAAVQFQAHSMRGMCASVGAVRCAELFEQIEGRAEGGSTSDLWPLVHRSTFELARVEAILREDSAADEERQAA